jgi:magnesium-transporting ATPase (P-type)
MITDQDSVFEESDEDEPSDEEDELEDIEAGDPQIDPFKITTRIIVGSIIIAIFFVIAVASLILYSFTIFYDWGGWQRDIMLNTDMKILITSSILSQTLVTGMCVFSIISNMKIYITKQTHSPKPEKIYRNIACCTILCIFILEIVSTICTFIEFNLLLNSVIGVLIIIASAFIPLAVLSVVFIHIVTSCFKTYKIYNRY